jgi:sulfur relay (sulfurtransferase) DsrC/TusE family protein
MSNFGPKNERLLYHSIEGVSLTEIHQRVKQNAASLNVTPSAEVLEVVDTLFKHYQENTDNDQSQDVHNDVRFLDQAFAHKGGSKYLEELFPTGQGVIRTIHALAGLPYAFQGEKVDNGLFHP